MCPYVDFCHGDCPRSRQRLCAGWKRFFAHAPPEGTRRVLPPALTAWQDYAERWRRLHAPLRNLRKSAVKRTAKNAGIVHQSARIER